VTSHAAELPPLPCHTLSHPIWPLSSSGVTYFLNGLIGDCRSTPRNTLTFPVAPNADEFQKSVGIKFRHCLGVSEFTVSLLITGRQTCILAEEIDFEIGHFRKFRTSVTFDFGSGHTAYRRVALIDLNLVPNFVEIRKKLSTDASVRTYTVRTDGQWDRLYNIY